VEGALAKTDDLFQELHAGLAELLREKLVEGTISVSEMGILRQFLKDNQIIFSLRKDYYLYELPSPTSNNGLNETNSANSSQIKELFNIGGSQVSLKSMDPLVYKIKIITLA